MVQATASLAEWFIQFWHGAVFFSTEKINGSSILEMHKTSCILFKQKKQTVFKRLGQTLATSNQTFTAIKTIIWQLVLWIYPPPSQPICHFIVHLVSWFYPRCDGKTKWAIVAVTLTKSSTWLQGWKQHFPSTVKSQMGTAKHECTPKWQSLYSY